MAGSVVPSGQVFPGLVPGTSSLANLLCRSATPRKRDALDCSTAVPIAATATETKRSSKREAIAPSPLNGERVAAGRVRGANLPPRPNRNPRLRTAAP